MQQKPKAIDDYGADLVEIMISLNLVVDYSKIREFEALRADIHQLDAISAPRYMRDFNVACDVVSNLLTKVRVALAAQAAQRNEEEAKAVLERAPLYFKENNTLSDLKDSTTLRNHYVNIDPQYKAASLKYEALKALVQFLEDKLDEFKRHHFTVKQMHSEMIGLPSSKSGFDGHRSD